MTVFASLKSPSAPKLKNAFTPIACRSATGRQLRDVPQRGDLLDVGLERRGALLFDGGFVHAAGVVVADLLRGGVAVPGGRLEHAAQHLAVAVLELVESAPSRLIGRNRVVRDPAAARELVEVAAGINGRFMALRSSPVAELDLIGARGAGAWARSSAVAPGSATKTSATRNRRRVFSGMLRFSCVEVTIGGCL